MDYVLAGKVLHSSAEISRKPEKLLKKNVISENLCLIIRVVVSGASVISCWMKDKRLPRDMSGMMINGMPSDDHDKFDKPMTFSCSSFDKKCA